jgi:pyruvate dehydrogenase E1 component subunit alpha
MKKAKKEMEMPSVPYLQILDEAGNLDKALEPDIPAEELLRMYRYMRLSRATDDRMLNLQRQGRIGTFGPSSGQEAVSVSAACQLRDDDWFVGSFRELGGRLVRGEKIAGQLLYYNGFEEGNLLAPEASKRLLPVNIIIGTQLLQSVGIGYTMKYRGEDSVIVAFMGDGATSQGDFHEAMNFATVWQVPVVFIIQNNQWAISVPREKQTHSRTLAQKALGYDMPGIQVDGNDALAMHAAVGEAIKRARDGKGPTLIEAVTYRLKMHTTADDPRKYRGEEEELEAWKKEPLIRFRAYLQDKGLWDDAKEEALDKEQQAEIEAAVKEFEAITDLPMDKPFEYTYATSHPELERQRQEFLAELKKEAGDA